MRAAAKTSAEKQHRHRKRKNETLEIWAMKNTDVEIQVSSYFKQRKPYSFFDRENVLFRFLLQSEITFIISFIWFTGKTLKYSSYLLYMQRFNVVLMINKLYRTCISLVSYSHSSICVQRKRQTYLHSSSSRWSSAVGFLLMRLMQPVLSM